MRLPIGWAIKAGILLARIRANLYGADLSEANLYGAGFGKPAPSAGPHKQGDSGPA